jgi:hypothetical protein
MPEIYANGVDGQGNCANLVTPRDSGTPLTGSSFYVHLGLQIGLNFVPGFEFREGGKQIVRARDWVFLWPEMYVNAGSLTSTYRVVRKYNFKS